MIIATADVVNLFRLNSLRRRRKIQFNYWNTLWRWVVSRITAVSSGVSVSIRLSNRNIQQLVPRLSNESIRWLIMVGKTFFPRKLRRFSAYRSATQQFPTTCITIDAFVTTSKDFCSAMLRLSNSIAPLVCSSVRFEEQRRTFFCENVFFFRAVADLMQQGIMKWNKGKQ